MAATMMCPAHGPVNGDVCSTPGCFEVLRPHTEAPETCPAPGCGMELPCPLHPSGSQNGGGGVAREAAAYLAAGSVNVRPQPAAVAEVRLEFPWGAIIVPGDGLIVGRDHGESCGTQIDAYDNVSRRHARVSVEAGSVFVEDLDSTNGTTVNGARIAPRLRTPVAVGDVLGFGNRLHATISTQEQP
ncbi:Uncharacterized conserved protein, contains FHA domain [Mycobacteroides abscessus subsp. massiliense]|nr:Uncharacterized conserved protein, contains FHA domain [Mycobacteroides abscessus subsp. massiliense]SLI18143.1 Uncharacterized conserved protein, contains FHA domain [Mycobacteroides abscessus subsp. massiliense]